MSMNGEDKDKWVDDLLAQLPTSKPVPHDISKQLDDFLADHIATLESQSQSNTVSLQNRRAQRFTARYKFMVAAAAVAGVLTFVGSQTSLFNGNSQRSEVAAESNSGESDGASNPIDSNNPELTPMPEESVSTAEGGDGADGQQGTTEPAPAPSSKGSSKEGNAQTVDPEVTSPEIQMLGSEGGTEYLPSDAPNVQITRSGMDYAKNLDAILDEIAPYGEPGKLNKLTNAQLACVVKFKLVDRVVAVDSGKYNGANVIAFFAIADDGTTKAYITKPGNSCELAKKVSIN